MGTKPRSHPDAPCTPIPPFSTAGTHRDTQPPLPVLSLMFVSRDLPDVSCCNGCNMCDCASSNKGVAWGTRLAGDRREDHGHYQGHDGRQKEEENEPNYPPFPRAGIGVLPIARGPDRGLCRLAAPTRDDGKGNVQATWDVVAVARHFILDRHATVAAELPILRFGNHLHDLARRRQGL